MSTKSIEAEAQVHLLTIRKALANRNAAVMVGAGFSRNAEGGQSLATWRQLSEALAIELEPERAPGHFTPAAVSQLAEQYARVFSPTHLEQLIKQCVPDDQVTPGRLHALLLELPWSEVFTTNYDTLLERAAERLFDASYFTVCAREDIPQSKVLGRRRIVKLHGSFPSHRPFILTEEEYRTYPERFAPFVNLVRQSLLENIFCLIGFSGDDPNFLHWLGWVRDMLDKHALPVYLFLPQEPTLGERKLYEARGVVPVVLPTPQGVVTSDYQARYRALFTELARPLADSPLDWGELLPPMIVDPSPSADDDQQLDRFMNKLPALKAYRNSYPGWLVAPKKIRNRFRRTAEWLEYTLFQHDLRKLLAQRHAAVILAVVELYGWVQYVMLKPWDDEVAEVSRAAFFAWNRVVSDLPPPNDLAFLTAMGCADAAAQLNTWVGTGMALLTWARQGHRTILYHEIRARLLSFVPEDELVQERLTYEDILLRLQRGDQPGALQQVLAWRPKSSAVYVHVLRGSLLAEVGEAAGALPVLEQAIQVLRRQQRSRPGDPALISQEAWACLVARNIQRALKLVFSFTNRPSLAQSDAEADEVAGEDFEHRLNALDASGYSASQELESLMADLNAEAPLPYMTQCKQPGFDLGSSSSRLLLTTRSEVRDKFTASLAWLELVERTGLLPQTGNVSFFVDQLLQAAWWSRFVDTPQRSFGLLLRTRPNNALQARDNSLPPHRTGWLGRNNVARFSAQSAVELCSELMNQFCAEIKGASAPMGPKSRPTFLLQVFSHLVIRVQNEVVLEQWGRQLLELHHAAAVRADTALWDPLSRALGRILEALPEPLQSPLILQALGLPLTPATPEGRVPEHELSRWLDLSKLFKHWDPDASERTSTEWRPIVQGLIQQLRGLVDVQVAQRIWHRLAALRDKGLLNDAEKKDIGGMLWESAAPDRWPVIPGCYPAATLFWPTPHCDAASLLLNSSLERPLRPFNSGGYMLMTVGEGKRSYQFGGLDSSLGTIAHAMSKTTPTPSQISKLIDVVNEWLDAQLEDLVLDLDNDQLRDEVFSATALLDSMLVQCVKELMRRPRKTRVGVLLDRIAKLDLRLQVLTFPRYYLGLALIRCGQRPEKELDDHLRLLIGGVTADDEQVLWRAASGAYALLNEEDSRFHAAARVLFDAVVACVFAQRMACMGQAMNLLANLPPAVWRRNLDQKSLALLDVALGDLASKLDYDRQRFADTVSDELLPDLRFKAFELAYALIHTAHASVPAAQRWLAMANDDPLPEVRLGRFKRVNGEADSS